MTYVDGFVIPVPAGRRQDFIDHARAFDALFLEYGATRVVECWSDDVPHGKQADFHRAVASKEDEAVVFSWIEWPDKATRDTCMAAMESDQRMDPALNPMPFDGSRMIFGGFEPVYEAGA